MVGHDSIKQLEEILGSEELAKKISPKFAELSLDLAEIGKFGKNPMLLAVLLFKLAEEREKTNKALAQIHDKFDDIMFRLKKAEFESPQQKAVQEPSSILSEQDQMIMHLVQLNGKVTAAEIKTELGYKGKNAASQRLCRLFKEGRLRKMQSGRKVFYLAKATPTP